MIRQLATIGLGLTLGTAAAAQSWQSTASDNGALIHAGASVTGGTLRFGCTAPSPQGRSLIDTGDHESHRTEAYQIVVEVSDTLFDWQPPYRNENVVVQIGQAGYRLPPVELNELMGSAVYLSMTDPMILALFEASSLTLHTGTATVYQYPVDGLPEALVATIQTCSQRWMELGVPISDEMNRLLALDIIAPPPRPAATAAPRPERPGVTRDPDLVPLRRPQASDGPAITFSPPVRSASPGQPMDLRAIQTANEVCGSNAVFAEGAFWPGDIDGDGSEDIVMNWGFVECALGSGTVVPVPGACDTAGQCRVTLFSSALVAAGLGDLSLNAIHAEPERPGVSAGQVFISSREPLCGTAELGFGCSAWLRFNGTGYEVVNQTALTSDDTRLIAEIYAPRGPTQDLPQGYTEAPQLPIPNVAPPAIDAHIRALCQAPFDGDPSSVRGSDIDGDGIVDFLVNWAYLACEGADPGASFCGAGTCRIDVFLSSRGYTRPEELLGSTADFVQDAQGRVGVLLAGTPFVCGNGACGSPWYWNGSGLAQ